MLYEKWFGGDADELLINGTPLYIMQFIVHILKCATREEK
jgi:hypothetical protein